METLCSRSEHVHIQDLWSPKFNIKQNDKVSTYGSCFAQHIGKALQAEGFNWFIPEQPPLGMTDKNGRLFNYNIFSSRTGSIYTSSLLKQWTRWALNEDQAPNEIWEKEGRFFDPFRPVVEPKGFESAEELLASRKETIKYFKESARYLNFTIGSQPLVDSAFLALALIRAPRVLWEGLESTTKKDIIKALKSFRTIKPHFNN